MGKCIKRPRTVDSGHPAIFPLESNKKISFSSVNNCRFACVIQDFFVPL